MEERWAPIEGFEGYYEISDHGNVRSLDRIIINSLGYSSFVKGVNIKPDTSHRYLRAQLVKHSKGRRWFIHVLVAKHFVPNDDPENKTQVDHRIEGDGRNNHYLNLQWLSPRENSVKHVLSKNKVSKYIGVYRSSSNPKKWIASISLNKKGRHLGIFNTEEEAADAYQKGLEYIELHKVLPPPKKRQSRVEYPRVMIHYSNGKKAFVGNIYHRHDKKEYVISRKDREEVERVCNEVLNKIKNGESKN